MQQQALVAMEEGTEPGSAVYFNDGSVDPESGTTGAAAITGGTQLSWKTSDHGFSLQTELVAIPHALEHAQRCPEAMVVVHTDSRAALQVLQQPHPSDNVWLITFILDSLQSLVAQERRARLHWIPSHVGIRGNKVVDETAKRAAAGPIITRHVPPSRRQVKARARRTAPQRIHQRHRELEASKRQAAWYAAATDYHPLDAAQQQSREDSVLLQRVRLGYCTREQLSEDCEGQECAHCARHSRLPLVHYLLSCPVTGRLRPVPAAAAQPAGEVLLSSREVKAALLVRHTPRDLLLGVLRAASPPTPR